MQVVLKDSEQDQFEPGSLTRYLLMAAWVRIRNITIPQIAGHRHECWVYAVRETYIGGFTQLAYCIKQFVQA